MSEARCHTEGWDAISSAMSDTAPHASARSCSESTQNVQERASPGYAPLVHQADRLTAILEEISSDGTVEVADLAGRLDVSAATIRRDLERLEDQRLLTRTHGGAVSHGVLYELPLRYKSARHHGGEAADRARGRGPRGRRHGGRPDRRHDVHRGRARAGRPRAPHRRHERAQHRERARDPPEPQAGRDRRRRPTRVLRAGRPRGRAGARRVEPRSGLHRGRRHRRASPAARPTTRSRPPRTSR